MTHDVGAQPSAEIANPHDHAVHVHLASDDEQPRAVELDPCPWTPSPARRSGADFPNEAEVLQFGHEPSHRRVCQAGTSRYICS
jgi:hypothetical protein